VSQTVNATVAGTLSITWTSSDLSRLLPPAPTIVSISPYPSGFFGASVTPCPLCVNGECSQSFTGTGKCVCQTGWIGTLCSVPAGSFFYNIPAETTSLRLYLVDENSACMRGSHFLLNTSDISRLSYSGDPAAPVCADALSSQQQASPPSLSISSFTFDERSRRAWWIQIDFPPKQTAVSNPFAAARQTLVAARFDSGSNGGVGIDRAPLEARMQLLNMNYHEQQDRLIAIAWNSTAFSVESIRADLRSGLSRSMLFNLSATLVNRTVLQGLSCLKGSSAATTVYFLSASLSASDRSLRLEVVNISSSSGSLSSTLLPTSLSRVSAMTLMSNSDNIVLTHVTGSFVLDTRRMSWTRLTALDSTSISQIRLFASSSMLALARDSASAILSSDLTSLITSTDGVDAATLMLLDAGADSVTTSSVPAAYALQSSMVAVSATPSVRSISPSQLIRSSSGAVITVLGSDFYAFPANSSDLACSFAGAVASAQFMLLNSSAALCVVNSLPATSTLNVSVELGGVILARATISQCSISHRLASTIAIAVVHVRECVCVYVLVHQLSSQSLPPFFQSRPLWFTSRLLVFFC
jgi:hypothetical protein